MESLIPIFGIVTPFLMVVAIIFIVFNTKMKNEKSKNEVIMKAIEKGVELSPEFLKENMPEKRRDPLTASLVMIGVGIGLFVSLYLFFDQLKFAAFGFIPLFIGLGQLAGYIINKKKPEEQK
jgi:hypothetical protein